VKKVINQQTFSSIEELITSRANISGIESIAYVDSFYDFDKTLQSDFE
jgi:hypothetical protein